MTAEHPEGCPVCGNPYEKHEQTAASALTIAAQQYSAECIQQFAGGLNVYYHTAGQWMNEADQTDHSLLHGGERAGPGGAGGPRSE